MNESSIKRISKVDWRIRRARRYFLPEQPKERGSLIRAGIAAYHAHRYKAGSCAMEGYIVIGTVQASCKIAPVKLASTMQTNAGRPDHLIRVAFVKPTGLKLKFADGRDFVLAISRLEMPIDRLSWATVEASKDGTTIVVKAKKGEVIPIDASSLRYLVDSEYAKGIDNALESLRLTEDEMNDMAQTSHPPKEWLSHREPDMRLESWK